MSKSLQHTLLTHLYELARPRHSTWDPLGLMSVRATIHEQLAALGEVEQHAFTEGIEAGTNLILKLPGQNPGLDPLLVAFDQEEWGMLGSKALTLPQLARPLAKHLKTKVLPVPNGGRAIPDVRLCDHSPFWDEGYDAVMVTDTSFLRNPHYHQMSDTLDLPFLAAVTEGLDAALSRL